MQVVSSGGRFRGKFARVNIIAEAMPKGLAMQGQFAGTIRALNPDAIFFLHPGSGPGSERRVWIGIDRTKVSGSNPTWTRAFAANQIPTGPIAFDSGHDHRIAGLSSLGEFRIRVESVKDTRRLGRLLTGQRSYGGGEN